MAELEQLYAYGKQAEILAQVDTCPPKDGEGNFIADQEKLDPTSRSKGMQNYILF